MKDVLNIKKFKNSFAVKHYIFSIVGLLVIAASVFIFLYNNYKEFFVVDLDGYLIGVENLNDLKSDDEELQKLSIVKVKADS